eukprot:m.1104645 g.1104645  ORF g.1104645 m.1104645 type:complete len:70 (-) comp24335_c0_seq71:1399-1608(-)
MMHFLGPSVSRNGAFDKFPLPARRKIHDSSANASAAGGRRDTTVSSPARSGTGKKKLLLLAPDIGGLVW